ncbi:MAG: M48 family peptidase, partial [Bacillales bacterium]
MARKIGLYGLLAFVLYGLFFYWYLFYFADTTVPFEYQGTRADPQTFLNSRELMLTEEYSQIRNFLFFISYPLEWLIYLFLLVGGISRYFAKQAEEVSKSGLLRTAIYVFCLSLFIFAALFPLRYFSYCISKIYNISVQSFPSWMKDQLIDFWINFVITAVIVVVIYWLIRKSRKRWWLYAWLLSIPFTLFMMFIHPVVIDPLYHDFYPLKNKELEAKILELAEQADI